MIACHVKIFILHRLLKQATSCRLFNYFFTESATALTVESTALTVESTAFKAESPAAAAVSPELLQATNATTTAIAKNTFFIFVCLIFKIIISYLYLDLKKVTHCFINFFFRSFGLQIIAKRININRVSTLEEEKLILKGLAADDKQAIETIYRQNYAMIQAFILNNNGSQDDARDIFQEAMIVLFEKARSDSFELSSQIKTYLYSVCRRLWLKRLNQMQRYSGNLENMEETVHVEEEVELHEKRNADFTLMENAMSKIGEPCKSLLDAYYIQKKNMQEIAADFGYTNADNAKTQKYKCLMRLKKLFFAQYKNVQ